MMLAWNAVGVWFSFRVTWVTGQTSRQYPLSNFLSHRWSLVTPFRQGVSLRRSTMDVLCTIFDGRTESQ